MKLTMSLLLTSGRRSGVSPPSLSIFRGYLPTLSSGTTGDVFVDDAAGNDTTGSGSFASPYKTLTKGMSMLSSGQHMKVRAGTYRETLDFVGKGGTSPSRTKVSNYGTESVTISAQETLLGLVPCVIGDASVVGTNWSSIYKKSGVDKTSVASSDPRAAFLYESGTRLLPTQERLPNPQYPELEAVTEQWLIADEVTLNTTLVTLLGGVGSATNISFLNATNTSWAVYPTALDRTNDTNVLASGTGSGTYSYTYVSGTTYYLKAVNNGITATLDLVTNTNITYTVAFTINGYKHAATTSKYTQSQIENADIFVHCYPNVNSRMVVGSYDTGTNTIVLSDQTKIYEDGGSANAFALINILPNMQIGEWGFTDEGSTCTIYVRPFNTSNITSGVTYSSRGRCINFGAESYVEVQGLKTFGASSAGSAQDGQYSINAGGVSRCTDIAVKNCYVGDSYRANRDYSPIWFGTRDNWEISQTTVANAFGQGGVFLQGGADGASSNNGRMDKCVILNSENSPIRVYGQYNAIFSWCSAHGCGLAAHSNKGNAYAGCHRVVYWGCDFRGCDGYQTWQEASSIVLAFSHFPQPYVSTDGRAIVDQNSNTAGQQSPATEGIVGGQSGDSYILNCVTETFRDLVATTNSLTLGKTAETQVKFGVKNNILHGVSGVLEASLITNGWRNNTLTSGSVLTSAAGTDVLVDPTLIYTDLVSGDTSISPTSPTRSATTASIASEVAVLKSWFPTETCFDYDLSGALLNTSTPPMGPYNNPSNAVPLAPIWIERPSIVGAAVLGDTLTTTDGYLLGFPYPTTTYQWQQSTDLVNWTNISGATSATYTVQASDVGKYVGRLSTGSNSSGTSQSRSVNTTPASSSYPIADPIVLHEYDSTANASSYATTPFSSTNKPLLVLIFHRLTGSTADSVQTATIGVSGGSRTSLPQVGLSRRSSQQVTAHFLAAPGTGTFTVETTGTVSSQGTRIVVLEIEGATNVGAFATTGVTGTTLTPTTTSTEVNGAVIYAGSVNWTTGASLSITGAAQLDTGTTGSATSSDSVCISGWERADSVGSYSATLTSTTSGSMTAMALEILS